MTDRRRRKTAFYDRQRPGIMGTPAHSSSGHCRPGFSSEDSFKSLVSLRSHFCESNLPPKVRTIARKTRVGWADTQGRRASMEDQIVILGTESWDLVAIFDGHNGTDASVWAGNQIGGCFQNSLEANLAPEEALSKAFGETNESLRKNSIIGGSTALVVAVLQDELIVGNAGDCRMILWRDGGVHRITRDHKPNDEIEKARVEKAGGVVESCELGNGSVVHRVNGILGVARAMGDFSLEPSITASPDTFRLSPLKDGEYFVIACDGLWDVLSDVEVVEICAAYWKDKRDVNHEDLEGVACRLRNTAYSRNSTDNISVVVVAPLVNTS